MFRRPQNRRITASSIQIQNAGMNTLGNGFLPTACNPIDNMPYATAGSRTTASGLNRIAAHRLPCSN